MFCVFFANGEICLATPCMQRCVHKSASLAATMADTSDEGAGEQALPQVDVPRPYLHLDRAVLGRRDFSELAKTEGGLHHLSSSQNATYIVKEPPVRPNGGEEPCACWCSAAGPSEKTGAGLMALKISAFYITRATRLE